MIVIKMGGSLFGKEEKLLSDLASLREPFVLVHGGGAETTALAQRMGMPVTHIISPDGVRSRRTTREMADVLMMVLSGKINKTLVARLQKLGVDAVGLCGMDGGMLRAKRKILTSVENGKSRIIRDDYTGKIERVDAKLLRATMTEGFTPVVSPMSLSEDFEPLNTDGDRSAAMIAAALGAGKLVLFTDVDGFYENFPQGLVQKMGFGQIDDAMKKAIGGMKHKLVAAKEAIAGGVTEVIIANGMKDAPVTAALNGAGTHISK